MLVYILHSHLLVHFCYHYSHFTDEESEVQTSYLPKVTSLVSAGNII